CRQPPVDEVQGGGGYVAAEFPPRSERQHQPDGACRHDQDEQSGWQEAPNPPTVELSQVDGATATDLVQERTGVIKKPDRTKKTSTPMNPPPKPGIPA